MCTPGPLASGGSLSTQPGSMMPGFSSRLPFGCNRPLLSLKISMNRSALPSVCAAISDRVAGPRPADGTMKYLTAAGVGDLSATTATAADPVHTVTSRARVASMPPASQAPGWDRDRPHRSTACDLRVLASTVPPEPFN